MKNRYAEIGTPSLSRYFRAFAPAALALGIAVAIALTAAFFTATGSRADGPPDLGAFLSLPIKLEQGRPAPAQAPSGPRQPLDPAATPAPPPTDEPPLVEEVVEPQEDGAPTPTPPLRLPKTHHQPDQPRVHPVNSSMIQIEWTESEGDVNGYRLQVSPNGSSGWALLADESRLSRQVLSDANPPVVTTVPVTSYLHSGLDWNQTRHYRVQARDGTVWSQWSASASATTNSTSPPDLWVETLSRTSIKVSWLGSNAHSKVTGWVLQATENDPETNANPSWTTLSDSLVEDAEDAAEVKTYTHSGLTAGATRYYRVRPKTEVGTGAWSHVHEAITLRISAPSAPGLSAPSDGSEGAILSWSKPPSYITPSGERLEITGYDLQQSPDGQYWSRLGPAGPEATWLSVALEESVTVWHFRIRANNTQGIGYWSRAVYRVSSKGSASAPTGLEASDIGATSVQLTWQAPEQEEGDPPITRYQVQRLDIDGSNVWRNIGSTGPSVLTFRDTRMTPGDLYHYRVAARDRGGLGRWVVTDVLARASAPNAPVLTATAMCRRGGQQDEEDYTASCVSAPPASEPRPQVWIETRWKEPTANGARIKSYLVERSPNGRDGWERVSGHYDGWNPVLGYHYKEDHEVDYGETWHYRVRAEWDDVISDPDQPAEVSGEDIGNYSPWSRVARATTRSFVPIVMPHLERNLPAANQIQITWEPPYDTGGSPISRYQIQYSTSGNRVNATWSTLSSPGAASRSYTHKNLKADTEYCYRIRAGNLVGWSHWQKLSTIPAQGIETTGQCFRLTPAAPSKPTLQFIGTTGVTVSWSAPDSLGLTLSGYDMEIAPNVVLWRDGPTYGTDVTSADFTFADLRNTYLGGSGATLVFFRVRAKATNGTVSDWSEFAYATIP